MVHSFDMAGILETAESHHILERAAPGAGDLLLDDFHNWHRNFVAVEQVEVGDLGGVEKR